jgi:copper chaperone
MKLAIEGMHCQSCVKRVQKALEKVEGTQVQSVEIGSAEVSPAKGQEEAVLEAVRKAGYAVHAAH